MSKNFLCPMSPQAQVGPSLLSWILILEKIWHISLYSQTPFIPKFNSPHSSSTASFASSQRSLLRSCPTRRYEALPATFYPAIFAKPVFLTSRSSFLFILFLSTRLLVSISLPRPYRKPCQSSICALFHPSYAK